MSTKSALVKALVEAVRRYPGSTARELSAVLRRQGYEVHKRDINPLLYHDSDCFRHDGGYVPRWSLVRAAAPGNAGRAARTAQIRTRRGEVAPLYQRLEGLDHVPPAQQPPPSPPRSTSRPEPPGPRRPLLPPPVWTLDLMPWQKEALTAWYAAGGRGVVEAVTGTGKTHVGLELIAQMPAQGGRSTVLVPTVVLQDQWARRVRQHCPRLRLALAGGGFHDPQESADVTIAVMHSAAAKDLTLGPARRNLLIADEVHRYGAEKMREALRDGYDLRLGLTATYERDSDEGIAEVLDPYFDRVVMSYGYDRAVPEGVVAKFQLLFLGVALTMDEREVYERLSRSISRARHVLVAAGASAIDLQRNLARFYAMGGRIREAVKTFETSTRARRQLLANSTNKTQAVVDLAETLDHSRGAVVFTQTIEAAEAAAEELRRRGVVSASVHSEMPMVERMANIHALEDESLRVLCAPRILDEGLDIPNIDIGVVLAASRSKRQLIQRLGRVIRKKDDARWAHFLVIYARGTVEDPEQGAHEGFLGLVRASASDEAILPTWDRHEVACRTGLPPTHEVPGDPGLATLVRQARMRLRELQPPRQGAPLSASGVAAHQPGDLVARERPFRPTPAEQWQARIDAAIALGKVQSLPHAVTKPPAPHASSPAPQASRPREPSSPVGRQSGAETAAGRGAHHVADGWQQVAETGLAHRSGDGEHRRDGLDAQEAVAFAASAATSIFAVYVEVPPYPLVDATRPEELLALPLARGAQVRLHVKGPSAQSLTQQLAGMLARRDGIALSVEPLSGATAERAQLNRGAILAWDLVRQPAAPQARRPPVQRDAPRINTTWCTSCGTPISNDGRCRCS